VQNKTRWIIQASLGLLLTGAGISMAIDAGLTKLQGGDWFFHGTGALVIFNAGLCLVIDAARFK
jgi:hypothetical protein